MTENFPEPNPDDNSEGIGIYDEFCATYVDPADGDPIENAYAEGLLKEIQSRKRGITYSDDESDGLGLYEKYCPSPDDDPEADAYVEGLLKYTLGRLDETDRNELSSAEPESSADPDHPDASSQDPE